MQMESIEKQLISSLIKTLIYSEKAEYKMVYKSLTRLPQYQMALNHMISLFSQAKDDDTKKKLIILYLHYVTAKKVQFAALDSSLIFDHFRHLVREAPLLNSFSDYHLFESVLVLFIQNLTTFSDNSLYSSITSWDSDVTSIALIALSEVHKQYTGNCLSNIMANFNMKISTVTALSILFSSNSLEEFNSTSAKLFKDVSDTLLDTIKKCLIDKKPEFQELGFRLLGSIIHFLPDKDSRMFYLNLSQNIISFIEKCDNNDVKLAALEALLELPSTDGDGTFNIPMQIASIVPVFGKSITDFDSPIANRLIEFTDKRSIEKSEFAKIIKPLFDFTDQMNSAALLSCRYDLIDSSIQDLIFPDVIKNVTHGLTACFVIMYLNEHKKLKGVVSSKVVKTLLSATTLTDHELLREITSSFDIAITALPFENVLKEVFENCNFLLDSPILDKIISILISYCQQHELNGIEPVSDDAFVEKVYPLLLKFSVCPNDAKLFLSYLFLVSFLSSAKTGKLNDIGPYIDMPLSAIFDELIPESCFDLLQERCLVDVSKIDGASLIAVSLRKTSKPNPGNIAQSIVSKDPFNGMLFERFFASAAFINTDAAIEYFSEIALKDENKNEDSTIFRRTMMSLFFQPSSTPTPRFDRETLLNVLDSISALKMKQTSTSLLYSLFETTYEMNPKSKTILMKLSKQHQKCQISDKLVQFILSSEFFVEVIPDFLYEIEVNETNLLRAFKTFFDFGKQERYENFCCAAFDNFLPNSGNCFSILASALLVNYDVYKMMHFSLQLCKFDHNNSEIIPKLTLQSVMNILSNDDVLRGLCQNCLISLFLKNSGKNNNDGEINPEFRITSLPYNEAVMRCSHFFDAIIESFGDYSTNIIDAICEITPIEIPIALLAKTFCKKHMEKKKLVLYLTKEGKVNHSLIKNVIHMALNEVASYNFNSFLNYVVNEDMSNDFTKHLFSSLIKDPKFHSEIITFSVSQFSNGHKAIMTDSDVQNGKIQLFSLLCTANEVPDDDFTLIWESCLVFSNFFRSSKNLSLICRRECRLILADSVRKIFLRHHNECPEIEDRDVMLIESFPKRISQFVFSLTYDEIIKFLDSRKQMIIKKGVATDIIVVIIYVLSYLLKLFIRLKEEKYYDKMTNDIADLPFNSKDEVCRIVTAKFASLFTVSNLKLFPDEGKNKLLTCTIRGLIWTDKNTQNSNTIFLSMILACSPKSTIIQEKQRLLDTITRCFDLKEIVGADILLDSILSIVKVDPSIEDFNSMGPISISRLLAISVNYENEEVRNKANEILKIISKNDNVISGFAELLGASGVLTLGTFILTWGQKHGFNIYSMKLLLEIAEALQASENKDHAKSFLKKASPAIIQFVNVENQLQRVAIDVLSVLME